MPLRFHFYLWQLLLGVTLCCAWWGASVYYRDPVRRFIRARTYDDRRAAARQLIRQAKDEELARLATHPHAGVALAAEWEQMQRAAPWSGHVVGPQTAAALDRFFATVRRRAGIEPPPIWKRRNPDGGIVALCGLNGEYEFAGAEGFSPARAKREGERLILFDGTARATVPNPISYSLHVHAALLRDSGRLFAACCGGPNQSPAYVFALDPPGTRVQWSTEIESMYNVGCLCFTANSCRVDLRRSGDLLLVLTTSTERQIDITALDARTGRERWRFNSSLLRN